MCRALGSAQDSQVALLSSEVLRLQAGEADKDTTLAMMRDEVADLQMRLRQCDTQWAPEMMAPPSGRDETVARLAMEAAERRVHMQELELEVRDGAFLSRVYRMFIACLSRVYRVFIAFLSRV